MQAIAVTTTESMIILHQIRFENGKYIANKEDELAMEASPTNFSLTKDSLVYCEKSDDNKAYLAFYRSTDLRCQYMWMLINSQEIGGTLNPGEMKNVVDQLV